MEKQNPSSGALPGHRPANEPPRVTECELLRRRRFLKAVAGAGALVLGGGELSRALADQVEKPPIEEHKSCTTTETYSSSTSHSESFPSHSGWSYSTSGIDPGCSGGPSGSTEFPSSGTHSFEGGFDGGDPTSTFHGSYSQTYAPAGGWTVQDTCVDGTFTETVTVESRPSYVTAYSSTESGTKTATCEGGGMARRPAQLGERRTFGTLPPHLDAGHDLREVHTRRDGSCDHRLHLPR